MLHIFLQMTTGRQLSKKIFLPLPYFRPATALLMHAICMCLYVACMAKKWLSLEINGKICLVFVWRHHVGRFITNVFPLRAKRVREVANLTERKNRHTPVYGVKEFVRLSVINFDPNYLGTGKTEWAEIFFDIFVKMNGLKNFYLSEKCQ